MMGNRLPQCKRGAKAPLVYGNRPSTECAKIYPQFARCRRPTTVMINKASPVRPRTPGSGTVRSRTVTVGVMDSRGDPRLSKSANASNQSIVTSITSGPLALMENKREKTSAGPTAGSQEVGKVLQGNDRFSRFAFAESGKWTGSKLLGAAMSVNSSLARSKPIRKFPPSDNDSAPAVNLTSRVTGSPWNPETLAEAICPAFAATENNRRTKAKMEARDFFMAVHRFSRVMPTLGRVFLKQVSSQ